MATLRLEIVTPEEKIYSEDVDMVTLPGSEGELGVYPKHVPLLTTLMPGELRVLKNGRETAMAIGEGFVEIRADAVSVLTCLFQIRCAPRRTPLRALKLSCSRRIANLDS